MVFNWLDFVTKVVGVCCMLHHKVLESIVYNGIDCPQMVVLEIFVCYVNLLVQVVSFYFWLLVVIGVGITSLSAEGVWECVPFCIGRVMVLECCSEVFAVLVVPGLLLQLVSFVVLCCGGPGRLHLAGLESLLLI